MLVQNAKELGLEGFGDGNAVFHYLSEVLFTISCRLTGNMISLSRNIRLTSHWIAGGKYFLFSASALQTYFISDLSSGFQRT